MGEKVTKTVKVPASKAEDWENYIEENTEVDSMSHLIRLSVEREMQGKYNEPQRTVDVDGDADSGEVLTALRQLQTSVGDLEERIDAIGEVNSAEASYDLKKAVYTLLPPESEMPGEAKTGTLADVPSNPEGTPALTPQEIANQIGADAGDVRDVLDEMAEETGEVQCADTNHDGNHYWKRGK